MDMFEGLLQYGDDLTEAGRLEAALTEFRALLKRGNKLLKNDDPIMLEIRNEIGFVLGLSNQFKAAVTVFKNLLKDQKKVYSSDHEKVLISRNNLLWFQYEIGQVENAIAEYEVLFEDYKRILGVITSYSIHYTKLYDIFFRPASDSWNFGTGSTSF